MNKLKIGALVALVSSVLLNVWLMTRPKQTPEIKTVEKIVTVEKVVTKDREVVKTVTRPDGTKIVTETKEKVVADTKKQSDIKIVTEKRSLPKYSLGLEVGRVAGLDIITNPNVYRAQIGYRLGDSPLWVTTTIGSDKTILVGFRLEF